MDYRSIIESKYNRENWQTLLYDIFRQKVQFWQQPQPIDVDKSMARRALYTGKITLPDGHVIAIYEVELSDSVVIERNRAGIRNLLCTSWRGMGCSGAFMFCYRQNEAVLRFSYVSESFAFTEDGAIKKESTDTKRFTYLLGEGHRSRTAIEQFVKLKASGLTLKDLTKAFSVEALSDSFFDGYKKQYEDIIEFITGKRMVKVGNKWEERLTGEPCHGIMQEFSQFPDAEKAVRDYVKKLMGRLVFIQFLQKKGWMGCSAGEAWNDGDREFVQTLFANTTHKDTFVDDVLEPLFNDINTRREGDIANTVLGSGIKVPYLNGGLFESDDYDNTAFPLPARFMKAMLDFFASYNFTIDENDPDDAEIGVDPEMLGRIFENLLEDNKDKGAFYTPKEIVQYMCRESLIAYLQTGIEDENTKEQIRAFVTTNDASPLSFDLANKIDQRLKDVKICDPAIGSGAFPMGLLRELYACRKAIEGIDDDNAVRIKAHIIQHNIYGVDIEKGAVDIARLRFWLALIVDEKTPHALPNMDFKIMQGNSLLEQYKGVDLSQLTAQNTETIGNTQLTFFDNIADDNRRRLIDLLTEYFSKHENKAQLREKIRQNVLAQLQESGINRSIIAELSQTNLAANPDFFLWHTWFADVFQQGGFNIVIGNPPYVFARNSKDKGMTKEQKNYYYNNFELAKYQINLYHLFIERGTMLLKTNGKFAYIVPNNWMTINTNKALREYVLSKSNVQVVNFYKRVFENADVDSSIIIYSNSTTNDSLTLGESESKDKVTTVYSGKTTDFLTKKDYIINIDLLKGGDNIAWILDKIENTSNELREIAKVKCGLGAYGKGDGIPPQTPEMIKNRVYHSKRKEGEDWFPYVEGIDVKRYELTWEKEEYLKWGKHLREPRNDWNLFSTPRILVRQIPSKPPYCINACYTDKTILNDRNSMNVVYIQSNPLFVLGVLNSRPISFWFEYKFGKLQRGLFPQFKINELAIFPIPITTPEQQQPIISLVETIMEKKRRGEPTEQEERNIDLLVYRLYGLTYDEVRIIDPETDITEEEYRK